MEVGSDTVSGVSATSVTDIKLSKFADFRTYAANRPIKRYYKAGNMYRKKGIIW